MASTQKLLALGLLVTIIAASGVQAVMTLDLETDAMGNSIVAGQIIDDEYSDWGVQIEAVNFNRPFYLAIAFDTLAPTGGGWDLHTDDGRYGPGTVHRWVMS